MIEIIDKKHCCGCHACATACPVHCITMKADEQGFLYPIVDKEACTQCGLCERVCPVIHQGARRQPQSVYAAKSKNEEVLMQSSSGGIFTHLAEAVIKDGGVVFGARFDKHWHVVHAHVNNMEELSMLRGSKYVQSIIGDTYKEAKELLLQEKKVLFVGTPCQIAGLKRYLRKEYANLLTVDIVCHGVSSPLVWDTYLSEICRKQTSPIAGISFRDKTYGWKKYRFHIRYAGSTDTPSSGNVFMKGFLKDLYLRPSCHACPARSGKSCSDITLGDFWGIQKHYPQIDDDKGTSLVLIHSNKGQALYDSIEKEHTEAKLENALCENPSIVQDPPESEYSQLFWQQFPLKGIACIEPICRKAGPPRLLKLYLKVKWALLDIFKRK